MRLTLPSPLSERPRELTAVLSFKSSRGSPICEAFESRLNDGCSGSPCRRPGHDGVRGALIWRKSGPQRGFRSDADAGERRKAVEGDGGIGRGVGAGGENPDAIAGLERQRQAQLVFLVENIGTVAGRPGQHHGPTLAAVTGSENAIADRLVHGFGQAMELADVEIDPAARIA